MVIKIITNTNMTNLEMTKNFILVKHIIDIIVTMVITGKVQILGTDKQLSALDVT